MSILLKDGFILTQNEERRLIRGDVYIEEDRIVEVGKVRTEADHVLDCKDSVIMPGLINAHTHVANTLLRGCADDVPLEKMLQKTFAIDEKLTRRDVQIGALLGCIEMIKSGTTSFVDMFYWEDEIARAVRESGIRAFLGWAVLDEEYTTQKGNPLKNCEEFLGKHKKEERIKPLVALQGVYVCSEETFLRGRELAEREGVMCHIHLSETRKEAYDHWNKHGLRPVEWLEKIGFLYKDLLAAHCVWLTINEVRLLSKREVKVAHCPVSNMKLASGGFAPLPEMMENHVVVSLGTDSPVSNNGMDMFQEMKFCSLMHKAHRWDASILPAQLNLDLATREGAKALKMEKQLGSIEEGKKADIIVVDLKKPHCSPFYKENVLSHLVYSCNGGDVRTTIVDGEILMQDRILKNVKEEEVIERVQEITSEIIGGEE